MASPPPPAAAAPTTIGALDEDLLREIFLRLPSVTSLARAAFACRVFLRAVRSSPAFRRRFRELHPPPLLAVCLAPHMRAVVPAAADRCSSVVSDPDTAAAAAAFADLLRDADADEWRADPEIPYSECYVALVNRATNQTASYSPHSQSLKIYPKEPPHGGGDAYLEFHALSPDDGDPDQRPSRVVCVLHERSWAWARAAVFLSCTMEWRVFPEAGTLLPDGDRYTAGTVVNGFVCWVHSGRVLALDTAAFQFSLIYLPPPLKGQGPFSKLGQTKDGELCLVSVHQCDLSVWFPTADDEGVQWFTLHRLFPLHTSVKEITEHSGEDQAAYRWWVRPMAVIDGFVYLSVAYRSCMEPRSPEWFLSFCLETAEMNLLHKESCFLPSLVDPYIMTSWPSSLIDNKDLETGVIGEIFEDDGPTGTEEASPVLFTALESFKEALIDDDNVNFTTIGAFLLDDEKNSLRNKISTLESGLATARDRALRIGSGSNNREGMERGSWWQMWNGRLGRAYSQFLWLIVAFSIGIMMCFLL
ncbi:hypothetical protein U9M48_037088 [Paspalum notatum var. saurae]|uniref:F-box protein AT5G49610-like beta-propeller domain-containing protein n=1 Tax=Paspalum notatum var. saurae TaxID=547442 RepID=A0AAQ3UEA0_PASNO